MSKYGPLRDYLKVQAADRLTLSFAQVSEIIGVSLPSSAYNHSAWWASDPLHVQAEAWLGAGFRAENISLGSRSVTFVRG
ncbi:MAG TPA: hypothetical protein VLA05_06380 [Coriobacteriia bacterium]|nr:hypothetical protein [Coriobacteriia bacterium]